MVLMLRCILYPGAKLFVTSGGKEQSAKIIEEKVQEICTLIPAFDKEIDRRPGKTISGKDNIRIVFKNGSYFDNLAAKESSRGKRRHGGVVEECVGVDGDILSSVIIPTMNVSRQCKDGTMQPEETLNKSQIYVTTAGFKNTFAYMKLIQFLVWSIVHPEKACVIGGTWKIPVLAGLQERSFIEDLRADGTFNSTAFEREYESKWAGASDDAFYNEHDFNKNRKLNQPEYELAKNGTKFTYYVISVDVGRKGLNLALLKSL